jgi:hypothetical protein
MMEHDPQIRVHIEELLSFFQIGTSKCDSPISPAIDSSISSSPSMIEEALPSPSIIEEALPSPSIIEEALSHSSSDSDESDQKGS